MEGRVETLTCVAAHDFSSSWTMVSGSTCCMRLTQTRRLVVTGCRRWSGCFACMRPRFISDGGVVNGIHWSRLNCYRIPARGLVTVLSPWVHAARWRFWLLDHNPGALDACGMRFHHLLIFGNGFPARTHRFSLFVQGLGRMSTRAVEHGDSNVQGCQQRLACIQPNPWS